VTEEVFHLGHRQRLRERFLQGGENALAPYEIIEMLLFAVNSRKDMKPLAKCLLKEFGTVTNVLNADEEELLKIKGMERSTLATLKLVQAVGQRQHREIIMNQGVTQISTWRHVLNYCEVKYGSFKKRTAPFIFSR
jgi:DNA repair protein RadC